MKVFAFIFILISAFVSAAPAREQSLLARVTVYWASGGGGGSDACTREHKCATGARLRDGHCAVDPKKIPYGSKVVFPDATCVAVDTGRDVINRKAARRCGQTAAQRNALVIDRFFETKEEALHWASANPHFMTVRVMAPNEEWAANKSLASARPKAKILAQNNSHPVVKHNDAIPRSTCVVVSDLGDVPKNKLLADSRDSAAMQLSRRF
jgi:3D (Asp-Asp-Asp) domain-containing protein